MTLSFSPAPLSGAITIPPSKSVAHRTLIAAALAKGTSVIRNLQPSQDILATIDGLTALGASCSLEGDVATVTGIGSAPRSALIPCRESGSTLRFLIPLAAALGVDATFTGAGKLPSRPITPYLEELPKKGIAFSYENTMPFSMAGRLSPGEFIIDGGISSQFITGLLFALPLLDGDSRIVIRGQLESKPYVDLTIHVLSRYHITITKTPDGYRIPGNQTYLPREDRVERDYSQAAFFLTAGAIGSPVTCLDLPEASCQGDREILSILEQCGAGVIRDGDAVTVSPAPLAPFQADARDIPDLVPILTVLATFCQGVSVIHHAGRLRLKESDRLAAISEGINRLGGRVTVLEDQLEIEGVSRLKGGRVDSFNDHRIAMSAAIASIRCQEPVILYGAESVNKSYPDFYRDFTALGGTADVIHLE